MFEQDYIMRLIKEMIRAILKLLFNIDTETPITELLENDEEHTTLENLLDMVDKGDINEAENIVFETAEDKSSLKMILLFYSYLNDKSDDFLAENNFTRKELHDDLKYILTQHGLESMVELFLS